MKIFFSYSNEDRWHAWVIKDALEKYGLNVFMAHNDIEPSEEWRERIFTELKECHVFLPFLTSNFDKSAWTDQETGIAYGLEKLIIPLKINVDPHGFIAHFQAQKIDIDSKSNIERACQKLVKIIDSKPKLSCLFREDLINKFRDSGSFDEAGNNARLLFLFENYTSKHITKIFKYSIQNSQIYSSYNAVRTLRKLFIRCKKINKKLLQDFEKKAIV
ncbi:MAG: toll/interleukin-1 receptor domain-containing protein [Deltaproteobacteria bacterium]|nr:toll/interleukin-1 receptor domain-containing protein [Deltaproteobacteria bacterium]